MNNLNGSDFPGLTILLALIIVSAVLIEGIFLSLFILSVIKWHSIGCGLLSVFGIVMWPLICWQVKKGM